MPKNDRDGPLPKKGIPQTLQGGRGFLPTFRISPYVVSVRPPSSAYCAHASDFFLSVFIVRASLSPSSQDCIEAHSSLSSVTISR